jgi:hypothetical protein
MFLQQYSSDIDELCLYHVSAIFIPKQENNVEKNILKTLTLKQSGKSLSVRGRVCIEINGYTLETSKAIGHFCVSKTCTFPSNYRMHSKVVLFLINAVALCCCPLLKLLTPLI